MQLVVSFLGNEILRPFLGSIVMRTVLPDIAWQNGRKAVAWVAGVAAIEMHVNNAPQPAASHDWQVRERAMSVPRKSPKAVATTSIRRTAKKGLAPASSSPHHDRT
jgi:hypothetical protein